MSPKGQITQRDQALGAEMLGLAEALLVRGSASAGAVGRHVPCAGLSHHNQDMPVCTQAEGMPSLFILPSSSPSPWESWFCFSTSTSFSLSQRHGLLQSYSQFTAVHVRWQSKSLSLRLKEGMTLLGIF